MECLGPECTAQILAWLRSRAESAGAPPVAEDGHAPTRQATLFRSVPYQEEVPAIRSDAELEGAFEHLEYGVFRRTRNQLTRTERIRLDNSLDNALFKVERYLARLAADDRRLSEARMEEIRGAIVA